MFYATFLYKYKCFIYIPSPTRNSVSNWCIILLYYNFSIKMLVRTGPKVEPAKSGHFWYILTTNLCISFSLVVGSISLQWYILPQVKFIISSKSAAVKKDFTSNYILNSWGTFTLCISSLIDRKNRCFTNGLNGLFRKVLAYIPYQPVYQVTQRPNKENGRKKSNEFYAKLKEDFQHRNIPAQSKFISQQKTEPQTSYLLGQLFLM